MNQETLVRPERYVKICMAVAALSLLTIAICQVIQVSRPAPQPVTRRPVVPMENRLMPPGMPPGMILPGAQSGPGMPEGVRPPQGIPPAQAPEKPVKK